MQKIVIKPGAVSFAEWRAIAQGALFSLDPASLPSIIAGADAVAQIVARGEPVYGVNTGFGKLASVRIQADDIAMLQRNLVISHAVGVGEPISPAILRLMIALKMASLARGASGVRPETLTLLERMCELDVLPLVPAQGSVGASGDLAPLAHMTAAMIGIGEAFYRGERMPAAQALQRGGLRPITLAPKEGLALLNGTQFSTAHALFALFTAERLFQTAIVAGALTTEAAKGLDTPFDPRIHSLRGHRGQIDAAAALRRLIEKSAIRTSHFTNDDRIQDPYCLRCQPQVMGAALGILRQAANTLLTEANGVSDNPLIFADTQEALSGGNFHAQAVAFAADMIALALCEIGSLSERRIALLLDPALSRLPAFLTPKPGLNSGLMVMQITAAALVSENKQQAYPASVDSIPTSANQEDHVSMAAHGARRLMPMAANVANIITVELICAAQGCDYHAPLKSSDSLERVRALVRSKVPTLVEDRFLAPDMTAVKAMIDGGAVVSACGTALPTLDEA